MSAAREPHRLQIRRRIHAPRKRVFRAWTTAEELAVWMTGPDLEITRAEFEARVGGALRIDMRSASKQKTWEHTGRVLELRAPEFLRFTWVSEGTAGTESVVTIELHASGAETELVLTHELLPSADSARGHHEGWGAFVEWLALHVAKQHGAFELDEARVVLERTPGALRALLDGLAPGWFYSNEGPETWNVRLVLGHLVHGERTDWMPRVERILAHGESLPFEPFDRSAGLRPTTGPVGELFELFAAERAKSLTRLAVARLCPQDLDRRGVHPAFGVVTLRQLLATWVVHDLGHLAQIARVMAKRYATDVGPWRAYLPILGERPSGPAS